MAPRARHASLSNLPRRTWRARRHRHRDSKGWGRHLLQAGPDRRGLLPQPGHVRPVRLRGEQAGGVGPGQPSDHRPLHELLDRRGPPRHVPALVGSVAAGWGAAVDVMPGVRRHPGHHVPARAPGQPRRTAPPPYQPAKLAGCRLGTCRLGRALPRTRVAAVTWRSSGLPLAPGPRSYRAGYRGTDILAALGALASLIRGMTKARNPLGLWRFASSSASTGIVGPCVPRGKYGAPRPGGRKPRLAGSRRPAGARRPTGRPPRPAGNFGCRRSTSPRPRCSSAS
jgi:hypothetical protein